MVARMSAGGDRGVQAATVIGYDGPCPGMHHDHAFARLQQRSSVVA